MAIKIKGTTIINDETAYIDLAGDTAVKVPGGTTGERPVGVAGQMRFNSSTGLMEGFNGVEWLPLGEKMQQIPINLYTWGFNGFGQLGDNTTLSRLSPVSVVGGFTDWISVSAGSNHSLGVRA